MWESFLINGPGCWSRSEVHATPAEEVFQHIVLAQRTEADQRQWAINAAQFHRMNKRGQKAIYGALRRKSHFGQRLRGTELVDAETRILIIGSELTVHGERWARRNREEMEWLKSQGISRVQAIRRHQDWLEAERKNPFWKPSSKGNR